MNMQRLPDPSEIQRILELDPAPAAPAAVGVALRWARLSLRSSPAGPPGIGNRRQPGRPRPIRRRRSNAGKLIVTVTATGTVQPTTQVDVSSEMSGVIRTVNVDANSIVKKGDVLAALDVEAPRRRSWPAPRRRSRQARPGSPMPRRRSNAARLVLDRQTALQQERFRRHAGCSMTRVAARDRAVAAVSSAEADIDVAKADVALQEIDIAKSSIVSPVDGIVLKRTAEPGQTVASSLQAPVLFTLAEDLNRMQVEADIDEADIGAVKTGQDARFTVDAYPGKTFPAKIETLEFSPLDDRRRRHLQGDPHRRQQRAPACAPA